MSDRVSSHRALPSQRSRRLHGFTVVEVLVVVTVIGVLAMFTFGSAQSTWDQEVQTRLRSDVQALALRIEAQFERTGKYPTTANLYGVTQTAFPGLAHERHDGSTGCDRDRPRHPRDFALLPRGDRHAHDVESPELSVGP
jgi:prepilin-type N-terminal cleavage/methylation domain-containing protein